MKAQVSKTGGLISLVGTDDMLKIKERIAAGEEWAALVYDWFAYRLAKYIGSYACVLEGKIDAIVMTGGVSNDTDFIANVKNTPAGSLPLSYTAGTLKWKHWHPAPSVRWTVWKKQRVYRYSGMGEI